MQRLMDISTKPGKLNPSDAIPSTDKVWIIEEPSMCFPSGHHNRLDLQSAIIHYLQLPTEVINIKAKLDKTILCGTGSHNIGKNLNFGSELGKI